MVRLRSAGKPFSGKVVSASQQSPNSNVTSDVYLLHISRGRNAKSPQPWIKSDCNEVGRQSAGNAARQSIYVRSKCWRQVELSNILGRDSSVLKL